MQEYLYGFVHTGAKLGALQMSSNKNRQATCGDIQPAIPTATQGWTARTQQRNRPMRRGIALAGRTCWEAVRKHDGSVLTGTPGMGRVCWWCVGVWKLIEMLGGEACQRELCFYLETGLSREWVRTWEIGCLLCHPHTVLTCTPAGCHPAHSHAVRGPVQKPLPEARLPSIQHCELNELLYPSPSLRHSSRRRMQTRIYWNFQNYWVLHLGFVNSLWL